ncbi:hypothetical protein HK101_000459 [Irineochytrium annulatum]|nr:hypothetical protein HK101_000459 [Irineochytrium annulatum]
MSTLGPQDIVSVASFQIATGAVAVYICLEMLVHIFNKFKGYSIQEKIQMTLFCFQETALSLIYLKYIKASFSHVKHKGSTATLVHTMYINAFVLALDLIALGFEYSNLYNYQIMFKAMLYAMKVKAEFAVLEILM